MPIIAGSEPNFRNAPSATLPLQLNEQIDYRTDVIDHVFPPQLSSSLEHQQG